MENLIVDVVPYRWSESCKQIILLLNGSNQFLAAQPNHWNAAVAPWATTPPAT
jgi:hypothetical protein